MKRVLIVGTSHSEATCVREPDGPIERMISGRWHDYFKNYDCEVVSLARAGCTVQQQFLTTFAYLQDNPDARFDIAIVEGRSLETNITIPVDINLFSGDKLPYEHMYGRWLTEKTTSQEILAHADSFKIQEYPELVDYFTSYVFSFQHAIDQWTSNYALCSMLKTVSSTVKWFAYSQAKKYNINPDTREIKIGKDIMREFLFNDGWPIVGMPTDKQYFCDCGHMNEIGHSYFWYNQIYPRVKQYL